MATFAPLIQIPVSMFTNNAAFLNGGKLRFFLTGTSTPTNVFSDNIGTIIGTTVTLDARGEPATVKVIWLQTDITYRIDCVDSADVNIWGPVDDISPSQTFALSNIFGKDILVKSTNYTVVVADEGKVIEGTGTFTLTLLAAATATVGFTLIVNNIGTGIITVDADGAETINGVTTIRVGPAESALIVCDASKWSGIHARNELSTVRRVVESASISKFISRTYSGPKILLSFSASASTNRESVVRLIPVV